MSNSLLPEDLAWLRQCAAVDGNTYDRVLLHLLERVEALEAAQQQPHQDKLDRLIELDRDDDEPTPEAAPVVTPAGGLVEMVCGEMTGDDDPSIDARAAIREVAAWLDQQGQHGCSLLLREEAGR
jgi:hypothetical protein